MRLRGDRLQIERLGEPARDLAKGGAMQNLQGSWVAAGANAIIE